MRTLPFPSTRRAALCFALAGACAPAARAVGAPAAECATSAAAMNAPFAVTVSAAPAALGARPLTIGPCRLPAERLQALASEASGPPVLLVEGVRAPRGATVLVFADRPSATAATPTSDPAYAGSFTLLGGGQPGAVSLRIPLTPALAAAVRDDGQFTLTLVAVGPDGRSEDPGATIGRVSVELH
jgi:hypothetical protein